MRLYAVTAVVNGTRTRLYLNARNRGHAVDQFLAHLHDLGSWLLQMNDVEVEAL